MSAKYEFIDAEEGIYPMSTMFTWAGVSSSDFYEWREGGPRRRRDAASSSRSIAAIFDDSDGTTVPTDPRCVVPLRDPRVRQVLRASDRVQQRSWLVRVELPFNRAPVNPAVRR